MTILTGFHCNELTFSSHSVITRAQITADSQWTMFGQDDHLSGKTFSWPAVIFTGLVHGFQINNWENRFIHINSVNDKTVKS